jgi:hypothetical protein
LRAKSPAPSITLGLAVLVQLVMAAMTTSPALSAAEDNWFNGVSLNTALKDSGNFDSDVFCSGRLGPANAGSTLERSNSRTAS